MILKMVSDLEQAEVNLEFYRRQEIVMDAEDAHRAERREELLKQMEFWIRCLRQLAVMKGVRCLSFDCFIIAIGHGKIIGIHSAAEAAKIYRVTKAAATECIDDFQKRLKIPKLPDQRKEKGCKKMSEKRKGQLK